MRLRLTLVLYLLFIGILIYTNPKYFYNKNGELKQFGTGGGDNKTLLPLWLAIIILAFFSYYIATIFIIINKLD